MRVAADHRRGAAHARNNVAELRRLPVPSARGPHQHAEEKEAFALALELLDQLPDEQRTTFVLAEFEELTLREISEMTGMNSSVSEFGTEARDLVRRAPRKTGRGRR